MISYLYAALIAVGTLVIGILLGIWIRKRAAKRAEEKISNADEEALRIVNEAIKSAENKKREVMLEAKEDILRSRNEYEKEVKERRAEQQKQERRLQQKEENLDRKTDALEKREEALNQKHAALDKENEEIKIIKRSQTEMLERISGFTAEDAKKYLIEQVESEVTHETALKIKELEQRAKDEADSRAREIVASAIQRCAPTLSASRACLPLLTIVSWTPVSSKSASMISWLVGLSSATRMRTSWNSGVSIGEGCGCSRPE